MKIFYPLGKLGLDTLDHSSKKPTIFYDDQPVINKTYRYLPEVLFSSPLYPILRFIHATRTAREHSDNLTS